MRNARIDRDKYKIIHFSLPMAIRRGCPEVEELPVELKALEVLGGSRMSGSLGGLCWTKANWSHAGWIAVVVVVTKKFNSKANYLGLSRVAGRIRCGGRMSTSASHVSMSRLYGHQIGATLHTHPAVDCWKVCLGHSLRNWLAALSRAHPKNLRQTHSMHCEKTKKF